MRSAGATPGVSAQMATGRAFVLVARCGLALGYYEYSSASERVVFDLIWSHEIAAGRLTGRMAYPGARVHLANFSVRQHPGRLSHKSLSDASKLLIPAMPSCLACLS